MITRSDVDGIPVLHAPRPGPVAAGLVFRVGQADETLPQHGITHMVEHLALHRQGVGDIHHNGATGDVVTHFVVRGSTALVRLPAREPSRIPRPRARSRAVGPARQAAGADGTTGAAGAEPRSTGLRRYPGVVMAIDLAESRSGWAVSALLLVPAVLFGRAALSPSAGVHVGAFWVLALTGGVFGLGMGFGTASVRWRRWRARAAD